MIRQLVSSQIQPKQSLDDLHYRSRLRITHAKLVSYMGQEDDLAPGLVKYGLTMPDLAGAGDAAAAIFHDNNWTLIGKTPTVPQIEELVDRLSSNQHREDMFCTNRLSSQFRPAVAYKEMASGLLALSIPKSLRNYILWFRPEIATTVIWAGNREQDGPVPPRPNALSSTTLVPSVEGNRGGRG